MSTAEWGLAWWCAIVFTAAPLLALVVWHGTDAFYRAAFALKPGHRGRRLPPGHMGIPLLGESAALMWYFKVARRPDGFVEAKRKAYGEGASVYRTHLFGTPAVIVCSPAANKFVLQSSDSFGSRWPTPEMVGLTSLSNVEGKQHTRLRGCIISAVNQPNPLRSFAQMVQPRVEAALRSWADKGNIIAAPEIKKVMFENICKAFISLDPSPLTEKMDELFVGLIDGLMAFPLNIPGTASHHGLTCRRKLNAVFREELERRRRKKKQGDLQEEDGDLMSRLMETEDELGNKLSDDEVVDSIGSLVVAAYDSTSTATLWAAYHLAKSPHILAKLREEIAAVRKSKNGASSFITYDDISKLKYTAKVVEEAIRVSNFAPMVHRVALRDVEYEGYTIPEGWRVVVWLRSVHTDAKYFKDPMSFNPDRWDEPPQPGTYRAFGGGYRACAGNMMARLQITIMIYHLSLGYEWKLLNPDAPIVYFPTPRPEDDAAMGFSTVADPGIEDGVGGLEVLKDGQWIAAEPADGSIVVNIGDVLRVLSNNTFRSATHRVVRKPAHRHSFGFFWSIHGDKWVEPLTELAAAKIGEAPQYMGFKYNDYMQQFMKSRTDPEARPEDAFNVSYYAI